MNSSDPDKKLLSQFPTLTLLDVLPSVSWDIHRPDLFHNLCKRIHTLMHNQLSPIEAEALLLRPHPNMAVLWGGSMLSILIVIWECKRLAGSNEEGKTPLNTSQTRQTTLVIVWSSISTDSSFENTQNKNFKYMKTW